MRRALVIAFGVLLAVLALLGAGVVLLAQSERGTQLLLAQAERQLPVEFVGAHGALGRGIRFDRVRVDLEDHRIIIDGLALDLRLLSLLFDSRLEIAAARADGVELVRREPPALADAPTPLQLPFMPVDIELEALTIARLRLPGLPEIAVRGAASWTPLGLAVRELVIESEALRAVVAGSLEAGLQPGLELDVEWALPLAGWSGRGKFAGPIAALDVTHEVTGPYRLMVQGTADLATPMQPEVDLDIAVDPLTVDAVALTEIAGRLSGTRESFVLDAGLRASTPYGDPFPVRASVRGSTRGPVTVDLRAEPLDGEVVASGTVDWTEALAIAVRGSARNLRLDPLREGLEGRVGATFAVDYRDHAFDVLVQELAGEIDGRRMTGHGRLTGVGRDWRAEAVELILGDNRAAFAGTWRDAVLDVAGRVDAPALDQLGVGATGALAAEVSVSGRLPTLAGSARITSPQFTIGDLGSSDLELTGRLDDGVLDVELGLARLAFGAVQLDAVALTLNGPLDRFEWRLGWSGGSARGQLRRQVGDIRLDVVALALEVQDHDLAVEAPFVLTRGRAGSIVVTPFCVAGGDARACVERFGFDAGRIVTSGMLERLPVTLLGAYLPAGFGRSGLLEGKWDVAGAGGDWSGAIELAARGLQAVLPGGEDEPIALPDAELGARFAGASVDITARAVGRLFAVEGSARLAPLAADGQITGTVAFAAEDLGWLRTLDQRITELGGSLAGQAVLAGTAAQPNVEGRVELRDGRIALEDPAVRLEQIGVMARFDRIGAFELTGRAVQVRKDKEPGLLELAGSGSGLFGGELALEVSLRGERLRATHPQWDIEVAPDLEFTYANGRPRLTGVVELPRAEVRFNTLPTSVPQPSPDVVVVGRESAPVALERANRVRMNVRVRLGRDVKLRALGIEAGLRGELNVRRDARGQASVRGTLDVTGGLISAQGQMLAIESGTVVYNGPIGNPYVDIRAVRVIKDQTTPVKVGLRIQGNVHRLTSTVFSQPAMAENRALAFLVLGRDIDQESESDNNQLLTAAINLGLSQSKSLTSTLQRISGLDELSAVAEAEDSFAIAAGKRISESIFLRYTYNTLTAAGAILVSFDLTERWRLEALSGESASMDILYRIER